MSVGRVFVSECALQYHKQSDVYKNTLKYCNMCFTGMFTVECIMKIAAFGVRVRAPYPQEKPKDPLIPELAGSATTTFTHHPSPHLSAFNPGFLIGESNFRDVILFARWTIVNCGKLYFISVILNNKLETSRISIHWLPLSNLVSLAS